MTKTRSNRIFGLLMTRNEAHLLRANIRHHLRLGCERILVVDNGSSDDTRRLLRRLARIYPVDWTSDAGEIHQPEIVTGLAHEARALGADWVLPLDTDEFWVSVRPLREICFDAIDVGGLGVERIEFIQARDQLEFSRRAPLRAVMRVEQPQVGVEQIERFAAAEASMFELAPPGKLLIRTSDELEIARGAHTATGLCGPTHRTSEVEIYHLPLVARDHLPGRVEHGERIERLGLPAGFSVQNRYFRKMGLAGRLDEAWRAHSYADGALDVNGRSVQLIPDERLAELLRPLFGQGIRFDRFFSVQAPNRLAVARRGRAPRHPTGDLNQCQSKLESMDSAASAATSFAPPTKPEPTSSSSASTT